MPPDSPDLNPIENFISILKQKKVYLNRNKFKKKSLSMAILRLQGRLKP